jgi:hypothetical protein
MSTAEMYDAGNTRQRDGDAKRTKKFVSFFYILNRSGVGGQTLSAPERASAAGRRCTPDSLGAGARPASEIFVFTPFYFTPFFLLEIANRLLG